jgi:hypothetical protein
MTNVERLIIFYLGNASIDCEHGRSAPDFRVKAHFSSRRDREASAFTRQKQKPGWSGL